MHTAPIVVAVAALALFGPLASLAAQPPAEPGQAEGAGAEKAPPLPAQGTKQEGAEAEKSPPPPGQAEGQREEKGAPAPGSSPPPGSSQGSYVPEKHEGRNIDPLSTRLINVATPVTTGPRGLELQITHRFRLPVQQGSSSDLYGLDSGADVGLGMSAGIGTRLDASFYRSSFEADYELAAKLLVLRQGPGMPISLAVRGGADLPGLAGVLPHTRPFAQLLIATRLAPGCNILVSPSWVSDTPKLHDAFNVPVGLTFPVPGRVEIDLEAIPPNHALHGSQTAWHAAVSKQVGWHIFKIVVGNSRATTVDQMLGGDSETGFRNRDVRLGFNLIRYFFY